MRLRRIAGLTAAVVATALLGVSVASALVDAGDSPAPPSLVAIPGSTHVDQTAPDPDGGLAWAVRLYDSAGGGDCAELGRLDAAGRFGRVDPAGQFAQLPVDEGGTCGKLAVDPAVLAMRRSPAGSVRPAATVVFGRASGDVATVAVTPQGGSAITLPTGPGGAFLLPRAGTVDPTTLPVGLALTNGEERTYDWR